MNLRLSLGVVLFLAPFGCTLERTEMFTLSWSGYSESTGAVCSDEGTVVEELETVHIRRDLEVREFEITHWRVEGDVQSGTGALSFRDFAIQRPSKNPITRLDAAGCGGGTLLVTPSPSNDCLEELRLEINERGSKKWQRFLKALNYRDGIQASGITDCSGQFQTDWEVEMRIWTWQGPTW